MYRFTSATIDDAAESGASPAAVPRDLTRRTARSALIVVGGTAAKLLLRAASMVILARLLAPKDFGLVAMVTVLTGCLGLLRDVGLSLATVQRALITHEQVSTLFWINVLVGVVLAGIAAAMAPVMAAFYGEPRLYWITMVVATGFVFHGAAVQHLALLQRQMRFVSLVAVEVMSLAAGVAVSVGMAVSGWGYWALLGMAVSPAVATAVGSWIAMPWLPGLPKPRSGIRQMLRIGGTWSLINVMVYVSYNIEKLLLGRFWGAEALGLYGRAYQLITLPTEQLTSAISPVAVSALSRLQHEPERLRLMFIRGYSTSISLTIPVTLLGALFAEEITLITFGPNWLDAAPMLRLLAPMALVLALINPMSWFLMSNAQNRRSLGLAVLVQVVVLVGVLSGIRYGPNGVALGYSLSLVVLTVPVIAWATRGGTITFRDVLAAVKAPLVAAAVAAAAGVGLKVAIAGWMSPVASLVAGSGAVMAVYGWFLLVVMKQKSSYVDLLKQLVRQPRG